MHNDKNETAGFLAESPENQNADRWPVRRRGETDPLSAVETREQLQEEIETAEFWQRWAGENPEGGTVKGRDGAEIEVTADQTRELRRRAGEILTVHAPARSQWLSRRDASMAQVLETYPALLDPNSREFWVSQGLLENWPELKRFPDYLLLIGDYLAGEAARQLKAAAAGRN